MVARVKRCEACVRRGRSCDGSGVPISTLDRILQEQRRIKDAERRAELELDESQRRLEEAQRELSEKLARLRRLRQQKEFLVERGVDMVARGLSTLDELESAKREESSAAPEAQLSGAVDVVDWGAVSGTVPELEQWVDPGSSGGTLPVSQGSGGS
ncbi:hypothetical protein N656DRAFT_779399 [Canariomyces notabilis]|uniref:Uncharacterized protein n=1 Tax=Canariomyces notabilis TaxID=2074819 RepID=A0AAN6TDS1_9PEZI|nr:hypothetical protein N656DRAFT_779399 [Canariomyces arenarius]